MEIEQSLVTDRLNSINTNQRALTRHINSIVKECCGSLDNLMNTIRETISNPNVTLTFFFFKQKTAYEMDG